MDGQMSRNPYIRDLTETNISLGNPMYFHWKRRSPNCEKILIKI